MDENDNNNLWVKFNFPFQARARKDFKHTQVEVAVIKWVELSGQREFISAFS